jgi:hypothetical protein
LQAATIERDFFQKAWDSSRICPFGTLHGKIFCEIFCPKHFQPKRFQPKRFHPIRFQIGDKKNEHETNPHQRVEALGLERISHWVDDVARD